MKFIDIGRINQAVRIMAGQQSKQEQKKKDTNNELVSALLQSPFYPLAYCKVLIQVTHLDIMKIKVKLSKNHCF